MSLFDDDSYASRYPSYGEINDLEAFYNRSRFDVGDTIGHPIAHGGVWTVTSIVDDEYGITSKTNCWLDGMYYTIGTTRFFPRHEVDQQFYPIYYDMQSQESTKYVKYNQLWNDLNDENKS